jgi:hypothetical protein
VPTVNSLSCLTTRRIPVDLSDFENGNLVGKQLGQKDHNDGAPEEGAWKYFLQYSTLYSDDEEESVTEGSMEDLPIPRLCTDDGEAVEYSDARVDSKIEMVMSQTVEAFFEHHGGPAHKLATSTLKSEHAKELATVKEKCAKDFSDAKVAHEGKVLTLIRQHKDDLAQSRDEWQLKYDNLISETAELKRIHFSAMEDLKNEFHSERETLKSAHANELVAASRKSSRTLDQVNKTHVLALEAISRDHEMELSQVTEDLRRKLEIRASEITQLNKTHSLEMDNLRSKHIRREVSDSAVQTSPPRNEANAAVRISNQDAHVGCQKLGDVIGLSQEAMSMRSILTVKRRELSFRREEVEELELGLHRRLQEDFGRGRAPDYPAWLQLLTQYRTGKEALRPLEDECEALEVDLNLMDSRFQEKGWNLLKGFQSTTKTPSADLQATTVFPTPNDADPIDASLQPRSERSSGTWSSLSALSESAPPNMGGYPPALFKYFTEVGKVNMTKDQIDDLVHEHLEAAEIDEVRSRLGYKRDDTEDAIAEWELQMELVEDFDMTRDELFGQLKIAERAAERSRQRCIKRGLLEPHSVPERAVDIMLGYSADSMEGPLERRFPLFFSKGSDDEQKNENSPPKLQGINQWLLDVLRVSEIQVVQYRNWLPREQLDMDDDDLSAKMMRSWIVEEVDPPIEQHPYLDSTFGESASSEAADLEVMETSETSGVNAYPEIVTPRVGDGIKIDNEFTLTRPLAGYGEPTFEDLRMSSWQIASRIPPSRHDPAVIPFYDRYHRSPQSWSTVRSTDSGLPWLNEKGDEGDLQILALARHFDRCNQEAEGKISLRQLKFEQSGR